MESLYLRMEDHFDEALKYFDENNIVGLFLQGKTMV